MPDMPKGVSIRDRALVLSGSVPVIFTDGACFNNGNDEARAGYGVAMGTRKSDQFWFPFIKITIRTSQKAELAGVRKGVTLGMQAVQGESPRYRCWEDTKFDAIVVATDSEYAVDRVTKCLPGWKERTAFD
ncbi:hypothetical protein BKA81DRAFT_377696 [Phyllosticta paracitricarpa]